LAFFLTTCVQTKGKVYETLPFSKHYNPISPNYSMPRCTQNAEKADEALIALKPPFPQNSIRRRSPDDLIRQPQPLKPAKLLRNVNIVVLIHPSGQKHSTEKQRRKQENNNTDEIQRVGLAASILPKTQRRQSKCDNS
jgi:hypothetical protein